jgi:intein/homing endonuclease
MIHLPEDIWVFILSYLDIDNIKKIDIPFEYFKKYLILRLENDKKDLKHNNSWYKGVYNNRYDKCFKCERYLLSNLLYIKVICNNCELDIDNIYKYPNICLDCVGPTNQRMIRGRIISSYCPSCIKKRLHLGIATYS